MGAAFLVNEQEHWNRCETIGQAPARAVHSRTRWLSSRLSPPTEIGELTPAPSPAGPVADDLPIRMPPVRDQSRLRETLRFAFVPDGVQPPCLPRARRRLAAPAALPRASRSSSPAHPDHVKSLLKAKPEDAPSLTGESPLRPILGPNSVLTSVGARHMRQRKLLLPPFHGEAVQRYVDMIVEVADREIDRWPVGKPFALAPRMQAVTLNVIMAGVFGIEVLAAARVAPSASCATRSGGCCAPRPTPRTS